MKRFIAALTLCSSLLILLSFVLFPPVEAKEDVLVTLLNLPAPPPPNPSAKSTLRDRDQKFYSKSNPPKDNAPIDELLDYWKQQSSTFAKLRYSPEPSDRSRDRLINEIEKDPKLLPDYLNVLTGDPKAVDFVRGLYEREGTSGMYDRDERFTIKRWLTYNSPYFSNDLAQLARQVSDTNDYVTNQDELLSLARVDFDKASPLIDRLYNDSSKKASKVLAKWALYRHALDTDSLSDIDRYRDELKAVVEDKALPGPMRDLAMDALVSEKEWPGRDEWYLSLLGDPTLADLGGYTGLTTLILISPEDKYIEKMLELVKSDNATVRGAAIRNLVTRLQSGNPEIVKALLPWLEDPKWAIDSANSRATLVNTLSTLEMAESVPGLIKILDERATRNEMQQYYGSNAPAANYMLNPSASTLQYYTPNAANSAVNAMPANSMYRAYPGGAVTFYPYRSEAVRALAKQKDMRAVPALRRILPEVNDYERGSAVSALLACHGFSLPEQLAALETAAKGVRAEMDAEEVADPSTSANAANWGEPDGYVYTGGYANKGVPMPKRPLTAAEISVILGQQLLQASEITDELARAIVDRIETFDAKNPRLAGAYRRMILRWQNSAINILLLRDVKRGGADADTILRLLSQRKELREKQPLDVSDIRTGKPTAIGIAACLVEDAANYKTILENAETETRIALLACARLIRAPLPIPTVAANLKSENKMLSLAAERYLETEDSPEARSLVLSLHPNEAKILGATTAFFVGGQGESPDSSGYLSALFQSVDNNDSIYNGWIGDNAEDLRSVEKRLQQEVKQNGELLGVYAYDNNFVRIYKEKTVFTWEEEASRYRERTLTKDEFDNLKSYLSTNRVDELPPFLTCGGDYCEPKELLMLGRNGGRRVYMNGVASRFFAGLDKYFADLRLSPAAIKYALSKELPGLEIIYASGDMHAETVWKSGDDLRVLVSNRTIRKKVEDDIENPVDDAIVLDAVDPQAEVDRKMRLREKLRYEGFSWHKVASGTLAEAAAQPPEIEFIPLRDSYPVQPTQEQWKARAPGIEIRAAENGLFKLSRGKLAKIKESYSDSPVVTPNGRWVVVSKRGGEDGNRLVRVNLLTGKEFPVEMQDLQGVRAVAYVASVNKVLLVVEMGADGEEYYGDGSLVEEDRVADDPQPENMLLLDPETGKLQPASGEFRPLSQETFRPLQKASKPGEFWAALPDSEKNETLVGIYDAKLFRFKTVLRIPKIAFNSMSMWVDDAGGKVYFVYRGHLLALPLGKYTG